MVQQFRGIRNHCWWPAGEDPSNSSFRRAMRKAAGTVSIVDKDAKCYTWLGNMRWFTGQFPKRMNPNKLAKDFCFQIAIAILCWAILLIFWSSWSSILGEFGASMKPMCQPWSNELIKVRCLKTWGVLKKNTMWLHRKTERSWNRRVFWTFLHFDSKCFLMGFDIPMCVGASRKPSHGKNNNNNPSQINGFSSIEPTWTTMNQHELSFQNHRDQRRWWIFVWYLHQWEPGLLRGGWHHRWRGPRGWHGTEAGETETTSRVAFSFWTHTESLGNLTEKLHSLKLT